MIEDWDFILTPQFFAGTVIAGLLLNILGVYVVRAIDRVRKALPASYRRIRAEESARIDALTVAATSDNALYAALAAESSRLRLRQLFASYRIHFHLRRSVPHGVRRIEAGENSQRALTTQKTHPPLPSPHHPPQPSQNQPSRSEPAPL